MNFLTQEVNYFILFLTFLFMGELLEVYLSVRNRSSIKKNRDNVPDYFKESIKLNDHQKAADYQTMIADFGFARYFQVDTVAETLCGTPLYMAPEIMKDRKYNYKSDLWSVGVILYQMVYGKRPYYASNILDLLKNIENDKLYFSNEISISSECKDLIFQLLQTQPNNRIEWNDFFCNPWIELNNIDNSQKIRINSGDTFEDVLHKITEQSKLGSNIYDTDIFNDSSISHEDLSDYFSDDNDELVEHASKLSNININEEYIKPAEKDESNKDQYDNITFLCIKYDRLTYNWLFLIY